MRLIDENDALEVTTKILFDIIYRTNVSNYQTATEQQLLNDTIRQVVVNKFNNIPTAYDIDKVVEQLEEKIKIAKKQMIEPPHNTLNKSVNSVATDFILAWSSAIEIVKGGGVNE